MDTQHLPQTAPQHDESPAQDPWRSRYEAERRKARILGATTVAVSLLAVGLGAFGLNAQGSTATSGPGQVGPGAGQFAPPGTTGGSGTAGQAAPPANGTLPGPLGQDLASTLLNADGSVNAQAVARFIAQMPDGMLQQMLAIAVRNGELTRDQADAISAAAGDGTSGSGGTSGTQET